MSRIHCKVYVRPPETWSAGLPVDARLDHPAEGHGEERLCCPGLDPKHQPQVNDLLLSATNSELLFGRSPEIDLGHLI
jgi:hypothetical protein